MSDFAATKIKLKRDEVLKFPFEEKLNLLMTVLDKTDEKKFVDIRKTLSKCKYYVDMKHDASTNLLEETKFNILAAEKTLEDVIESKRSLFNSKSTPAEDGPILISNYNEAELKKKHVYQRKVQPSHSYMSNPVKFEDSNVLTKLNIIEDLHNDMNNICGTYNNYKYGVGLSQETRKNEHWQNSMNKVLETDDGRKYVSSTGRTYNTAKSTSPPSFCTDQINNAPQSRKPFDYSSTVSGALPTSYFQNNNEPSLDPRLTSHRDPRMKRYRENFENSLAVFVEPSSHLQTNPILGPHHIEENNYRSSIQNHQSAEPRKVGHYRDQSKSPVHNSSLSSIESSSKDRLEHKPSQTCHDKKSVSNRDPRSIRKICDADEPHTSTFQTKRNTTQDFTSIRDSSANRKGGKYSKASSRIVSSNSIEPVKVLGKEQTSSKNKLESNSKKVSNTLKKPIEDRAKSNISSQKHSKLSNSQSVDPESPTEQQSRDSALSRLTKKPQTLDSQKNTTEDSITKKTIQKPPENKRSNDVSNNDLENIRDSTITTKINSESQSSDYETSDPASSDEESNSDQVDEPEQPDIILELSDIQKHRDPKTHRMITKEHLAKRTSPARKQRGQKRGRKKKENEDVEIKQEPPDTEEVPAIEAPVNVKQEEELQINDCLPEIPTEVQVVVKEEPMDDEESNAVTERSLVSRLEFIRTLKSFAFLCSAESCGFESNNKSFFQEHLRNSDHANILWDGYCQACEGQIKPEDTNLAEEFNHLLLIHAKMQEEVFTIQDRDELSTEPAFKLRKIDQLANEATRSLIDADDNRVYLKPWIPEQREGSFFETTLKCIIKNYKCMKCQEYYTDKRDVFFNHLQSHENLEHEGEPKKYLECSYCEVIAENAAALIEHLKAHESCCYQCKHCFYRSPYRIFIEEHQKMFHIMISNPGIAGIKPINKLAESKHLIEELQKKKTENLLPFECPVPNCSFVTFIKNFFEEHTFTHDAKYHTCKFCDTKIRAIDYIAHLKCHDLNSYHCLFCRKGYDSPDGVLIHLTNFHSGMVRPTYYNRIVEASKSNYSSKEISEIDMVKPCIFETTSSAQ